MLQADDNAEAGFSLIEAIVSFAILALVLTVTFSAGTLGLRASHNAELQTQALLEAQSLSERVGIDLPLAAGIYDGTTDLGHAFRIEISAEQYGGDSQHDLGFSIRTEIRARGADKTPLLSLHSYRMKALDAQP